MIVVQGKEGLKPKAPQVQLSLFFNSMFVIQKRFKTIADKVLQTTAALENIH